MDISSQDKKLGQYVENPSKAQKELGQKRAMLLAKRISQIAAAENLEVLRMATGHYHELTENRKGQWACDLDQPYRLIFEPHEDPIPTDENGRYIWVEIRGIELIEIANYHGK